MKFLLVMQLDVYHDLLAICEKGELEYTTLKNGVIVENGDGNGHAVHILAERDKLELLRRRAHEKHPAAESYIEAALLKPFATNI